MHLSICRVIPLIVIALFAGQAATWHPAPDPVEGNVDLPRFPAVSPDGSRIVFSWRGHLWKVPSHGGRALQLTNHPADDLHSAWSPDGSRIAFNSTRDGHLNIYVINSDGTNLRQLTNIDRACTLTGYGADEHGNEVVTFEAQLEGDVYRSPRPYMVDVETGEASRIHNAFGGYPVFSHDGSQLAFTRGGMYDGWNRRHYRGSESQNVWLYDREQETFTQLTTRRGHDGKPRWGTPGKEEPCGMYYLSDRELDTVNLWWMCATDGDEASVRMTSFRERDVQDFDVSRDGRRAVLMVWDTLYTLDLTNPDAEPVPLVITAGEDDRDNYEWKQINREVSEAALSPDGQVMAFVAYGRVYVRNVADKSPTRLVSPAASHARHRDLAWSPDGVRLYFVSDEDGTDSIYEATVSLTRSGVHETYERTLGIAVDEQVEPELESDEDIGAEEVADDQRTNGDADDASVDDAHPTDEADGEHAEEPETPTTALARRWHDALVFDVAPVVQTADNDRSPSPSPDSTALAFRRGRGDLMILDLDTWDVRRLIESWDTRLHWRWSPDSQHIAYAQYDLNFSSDIHIVPADGSAEPVNVTRHPRNDTSPRWSHDGRILSFISNRGGGEGGGYDLWMVHLDKALEGLTPRERDEYYAEAVRRARDITPPGGDTSRRGRGDRRRNGDNNDNDRPRRRTLHDRPAQMHLDDAYLRLQRVTRHGNVSGNDMTPAGDRYVYLATIDDARALYSIKWDGNDRKRLTGNVNVQHLSLTGDKVVFVSGGRGGTAPVTGGSEEYIDIRDRLRIDLQEQASQKFLEAARFIGENFYHNEIKGLDWETITRDYHALARQTRTASEFNHVGNRFLGELNGSHLGIRARDPENAARQPHGRIGTVHQRVTLNDGTIGYRIDEILPRSPADISPLRLEVGDVITAIEMRTFGPGDTVESALQSRSGEETLVEFRRTLEDGREVELHSLITPISFGAEYQLRYQAWTDRNRDLVNEWSGGRIGYIHIQSMNQPSLDLYERDLNAAAGGKDGLIIDVRNNGGGWTTDRLLASIMAHPHAYTVPRGADQVEAERMKAYPQDRLFIQRYPLPINMLCNEKSFSNAEIISHAFKTLGRGTLVGQETYGGVISTGGFTLIDGTFVRNPFRGWFLYPTDDEGPIDMEERGAIPDIIVPQTPEAEVSGEDEQLKAALEDLMQRLE